MTRRTESVTARLPPPPVPIDSPVIATDSGEARNATTLAMSVPSSTWRIA